MPYCPFIKVLDNLNSTLMKPPNAPSSASPGLLSFNLMGFSWEAGMEKESSISFHVPLLSLGSAGWLIRL